MREVLFCEKRKTDEVDCYFVTQEEIARLHDEFMGDSSPTDCISFPLDGESEGGYHILGEVFVCPKTALNYVQGKVSDAYRETTLYLVHGILHCLGYDDIEESDRQKMREAENRLLSHLQEKQLLLNACC